MIVPAEPPEIARKALITLLPPETDPDFLLVGRRGYYRDALGAVGRNDRGIYDDAIFLLTPTAFVAYNANCDPSVYQKSIAVLLPGSYLYRIGIHGLSRPKHLRYKALVQADEVVVARDQSGIEKGWFGINIHRGGKNSTSSLGCQTIYPKQWDGFITLVESEMKRHGKKVIPYVLTARADAA